MAPAMIRFHQTFGAHAGRVVELDQDVIRFGRMPDSDVAFDSDADLDASGRHAEVRREAGGWVVADTGSRNGTWIGGERVHRRPLHDGDEIEFGRGGPRLRVEIPDDSPRAAQPAQPGAGPARRSDGGWHRPTPPSSPTGEATPPMSEAEAPTLAALPTPLPPGPEGGAAPQGVQPPSDIGMGSPAAATPSDKRYGERTLDMMVREAEERARRQERERSAGQGREHDTGFIRQVAQAEAGRSTLWLKVGLGCVAAALVLALGATTVLFLALREEQAAKGPRADAGVAERALDRVVLPPEEISSMLGAGVFVLRVEGDPGERVCTGFAVRDRMIATTARCVGQLQERRRNGATLVAAPLAEGDPLPLERMWRHPAFDVEGLRPQTDAGLIEVAAKAGATLELAGLDRLALLASDESLYLHIPSGDGAAGRLEPVKVQALRLETGSPGRATPPAVLELASAHPPLARGAPLVDGTGTVVGLYVGEEPGGQPVGVRGDVVIALLAGLDAPPG